jgi:hypothetical protein
MEFDEARGKKVLSFVFTPVIYDLSKPSTYVHDSYLRIQPARGNRTVTFVDI